MSAFHFRPVAESIFWIHGWTPIYTDVFQMQLEPNSISLRICAHPCPSVVPPNPSPSKGLTLNLVVKIFSNQAWILSLSEEFWLCFPSRVLIQANFYKKLAAHEMFHEEIEFVCRKVGTTNK